MLLLALSDAHIPERAIDLPHKFKKLIGVPNKIEQVVLLGNCTKSYSFVKFVEHISSNIVVVRGEFDSKSLPSTKNAREEIPLSTIIKQGNFTIGCCNGYTVVPKSDPLALLTLARQLDVDIILWGGTHNVEAYTLEGKFFINPGTCTGAFSTDWPPSQDPEAEPDKKTDETGSFADAEPASAAAAAAAAVDETNEAETESDDEADTQSVSSFCLLDIQGSTCTLYIYTLVEGEVKVDKVVYNKS
ncbi:retromer subunit VPS29 LALA0_S09e01068g [Lachancea lanzarotensis]|uniref:Vacuolar protein sorting-associated protein 29 n=1 Tax=Lachancea lanzarotensis TaxID=1245769 RepID=A0A0C7NDH4_9SACH|nr:uncharacterized protein LALA0_S09e01068g [Lachancea lanzarotensis]CEP63724.1 LALA0S09e01068g1_1 [Lachancea lanzarotensis]